MQTLFRINHSSSQILCTAGLPCWQRGHWVVSRVSPAHTEHAPASERRSCAPAPASKARSWSAEVACSCCRASRARMSSGSPFSCAGGAGLAHAAIAQRNSPVARPRTCATITGKPAARLAAAVSSQSAARSTPNTQSCVRACVRACELRVAPVMTAPPRSRIRLGRHPAGQPTPCSPETPSTAISPAMSPVASTAISPMGRRRGT
jgi:hypothetical protein